MIDKFGERNSEGQSTSLHGTGFEAKSLVGVVPGSQGSRLVLTRN